MPQADFFQLSSGRRVPTTILICVAQTSAAPRKRRLACVTNPGVLLTAFSIHQSNCKLRLKRIDGGLATNPPTPFRIGKHPHPPARQHRKSPAGQQGTCGGGNWRSSQGAGSPPEAGGGGGGGPGRGVKNVLSVFFLESNTDRNTRFFSAAAVAYFAYFGPSFRIGGGRGDLSAI